MKNKFQKNKYNFGPNIGSNQDARQLIGDLPCCQIFVQEFKKSYEPTWEISETEIDYYRGLETSIYVHSTFNVNLNKYFPTIKHFQSQYILSSRIGAKGIIVHLPREYTQLSTDVFSKMFNGLPDLEHYPIVYLEHVVSSASDFIDPYQLVRNVDKMINALIMNGCKRITFGICIDTCHLYASGYLVDLSSMKEYVNVVSENYWLLIHLNDSKHEFGSGIDRHADIGTNIFANEIRDRDTGALYFLLTSGHHCILELSDIEKNIQICKDHLS